jgi:phosphoribosylanthranilate isomerase
MPHRTRIKICGLTRPADVAAACEAGADAIGLVMYPPSARAVTAERARELATVIPAAVTPVLLFVNAQPQAIEQALRAVPNATLQFHGDESPEVCQRWGRPYWRAVRIPAGAGADTVNLLEWAEQFASAQALLLDAHVQGYGGSGQRFNWRGFDWSQPALNASRRVVLSGGLTPANAADGVRLVRPWAVDVSSGVEDAKGIKNANLMHQFVAAVHAAHHPSQNAS